MAGRAPITPVNADRLARVRKTQQEQYQAKLGFLRRLYQQPGAERLVLRGSVLLKAWVGEDARPPGDIDLVALDQDTRDRAMQLAIAACEIRIDDGLVYQRPHTTDWLWDYSDAPGERLRVPYRIGNQLREWLQVDVAVGEPIEPPPVIVPLSSAAADAPFDVPASSPELSLAWKLRWILADNFSRPNDVYDAWLLVTRLSQERDALHRAIRSTFEHGEIPVQALQRYCDLDAAEPLRQAEHVVSPPGSSRIVRVQECVSTLALQLPQLLAGLVTIPTPEEYAFIREILRKRKETAARLVYADWLEEQGDVRGEFLRLDARLAHAPRDADGDAALRTRYNELRRLLDGYWVGLVSLLPPRK